MRRHPGIPSRVAWLLAADFAEPFAQHPGLRYNLHEGWVARLEKNELVAYWRDTAEKDYQTMKHLYADYVTSHIRFYRPSLPRRIRWRGRLCKLGFA